MVDVDFECGVDVGEVEVVCVVEVVVLEVVVGDLDCVFE